jgi:hypothetical protein
MLSLLPMAFLRIGAERPPEERKDQQSKPTFWSFLSGAAALFGVIVAQLFENCGWNPTSGGATT